MSAQFCRPNQQVDCAASCAAAGAARRLPYGESLQEGALKAPDMQHCCMPQLASSEPDVEPSTKDRAEAHLDGISTLIAAGLIDQIPAHDGGIICIPAPASSRGQDAWLCKA